MTHNSEHLHRAITQPGPEDPHRLQRPNVVFNASSQPNRGFLRPNSLAKDISPLRIPEATIHRELDQSYEDHHLVAYRFSPAREFSLQRDRDDSSSSPSSPLEYSFLNTNPIRRQGPFSRRVHLNLDENDRVFHREISSGYKAAAEFASIKQQTYDQGWEEACSICFHNRCDFSFPVCQDQFCRSCIKKYFTDKILSSAWGITPVVLTCPVCYDKLTDDVISKYVDDEVFRVYQTHNAPLHAVQRYCPKCGQGNSVVGDIPENSQKLEAAQKEFSLRMAEFFPSSHYCETFQKHYSRFLNASTSVGTSKNEDRATNSYLCKEFYGCVLNMCLSSIHERNLKRSTSSSSSQDCDDANDEESDPADSDLHLSKKKKIHHSSSLVHPLLATFRQSLSQKKISSYEYTQLSSFSQLLIRQIPDDIKRLEMQFLFIYIFPFSTCAHCQAQFCYQCGEPNWHEQMSCEDYMYSRVRRLSKVKVSPKTKKSRHNIPPSHSSTSTSKSPVDKSASSRESKQDSLSQELSSLKWKLSRSKRCPSCFCFIERDDGCNKMNCSYCGYEFCWQCLQAWSTKCGFYNCQKETTDSKNLNPSKIAPQERSQSDLLAVQSRDEQKPSQESQDLNALLSAAHTEGALVAPSFHAFAALVSSETDSDSVESLSQPHRQNATLSTLPEIGVPDVLEIFRRTSGSENGVSSQTPVS
eukprot:Sdes_comp20717_c0_seq2m16430